MIGLRDLRLRRFGVLLAGLAIYLQLAFASWGMLALAVPGQPADALGEHALCLADAGNTPQPTAPADSAPVAPAHDHLALCCLWHSLPAVTPQVALVPRPVAYAAIAHDELGSNASIAGLSYSPANARAPPALI